MQHHKQQHIKNIYGKDPESLDEIAEASIAVINQFSTVIGLAWKIAYNPVISNSSSGPIDGIINWGGHKPNMPRSYPGYYGRVWIRLKEYPTGSSVHNYFSSALSYTGTGGHGAYNGLWSKISSAAHQSKNMEGMECHPGVHCYSWDYRFFLSDFPGYNKEFNKLIDGFNKEHEWDLLKNRNIHATFKHSHNFVWEDPETKAADEEFIKLYHSHKELADGV